MTYKTITFQFCFDISNHSDWWKYFSLIAYEHNQMYGKVIGQLLLFVPEMLWLKLTGIGFKMSEPIKSPTLNV